MKKAADYIAVSAFFVIVIMFAAYTLVMGRHGSESEKADSSDKDITFRPMLAVIFL